MSDESHSSYANLSGVKRGRIACGWEAEGGNKSPPFIILAVRAGVVLANIAGVPFQGISSAVTLVYYY